MSVDLDELARMNGERTQGEWITMPCEHEHGMDVVERDDGGYTAIALDVRARDARAIVALVNAGDALVRVAMAADRYVAAYEGGASTDAAHDDLLAAVRAMKETR